MGWRKETQVWWTAIGTGKGFCLLSPILSYVTFFVWSLLLPLWPRVAQDSRNPLDIRASGLLRRCVLFYILPSQNILGDRIFASAFLLLSGCFYPFTEALPVTEIIYLKISKVSGGLGDDTIIFMHPIPVLLPWNTSLSLFFVLCITPSAPLH